MSREIKFRAWDGKKMHNDIVPWRWDFVISNAWHRCEKSTGNGPLGYGGDYAEMLVPAVRFKEVMQFTGLKDKNGKEVYEGDLIKMYQHDDNTYRHEPARTWKDGKYIIDPPKEVKFMYGSFVIWNDLIKDYRCFANLARPGESFEVVGNIYEQAKSIPAGSN